MHYPAKEWAIVVQTPESLRAVESMSGWSTASRNSSKSLLESCQQRLQSIHRYIPMIIYGDEDSISSDGARFNPRFKPARNRELFWSDPSTAIIGLSVVIFGTCLPRIDGQSWSDIQYLLLAHAALKSIAYFPLVFPIL